jgi:hypothetical protein
MQTALDRLRLGRKTLTPLALLTLLGACTTTRLDKFETKLDVDSKLKFEFHRIVDDPNGLGLRFPGLVLGFEKADRELIDCPQPDSADFSRHIDLQRAEGGKPSTVREHLEDRLDDGKCIFLTHVVEYGLDQERSGIEARFIYRSVYPDPFSDPKGPQQPPNGLEQVARYYERSWTMLDPAAGAPPAEKAVHTALETRLADDGYTHVILYTLGWNSGQTEALRNVNSLHLALLHGARAAGISSTAFKPYPILVTWPSHWPWYAGPLSYVNKANDADELGAVFLNAIAHRLILPMAKSHGLRTVAIGHSFGARALTRALASRALLAAGSDDIKWDLLIGLQGAFSINRFAMVRGSWEGAPYRWISKYASKVVLSWSEHDKANRQALWSNHAGGSSGGARAVEINAAYGEMHKPDIFDRQVLAGAADVPRYRTDLPHQVLYLNATQLVAFDNYAKAGGAHSDIYTEEMGSVISALIQRYAQ